MPLSVCYIDTGFSSRKKRKKKKEKFRARAEKILNRKKFQFYECSIDVKGILFFDKIVLAHLCNACDILANKYTKLTLLFEWPFKTRG